MEMGLSFYYLLFPSEESGSLLSRCVFTDVISDPAWLGNGLWVGFGVNFGGIKVRSK